MNYDIDFDYNNLIVKKRLDYLLYRIKTKFILELHREYYIYLECFIVFNRYV